jgi:antitoxin (DNA-binding transcriptional repressor) of toxin-antitoxin stability system
MNAHAPFDQPVTIHDAKTNLSRLVAEAEAGREIILARGKKPVAKIVPLNPPAPKRRTAGRFKHLAQSDDILGHGFWDPLPAEDAGLGSEVDPRL